MRHGSRLLLLAWLRLIPADIVGPVDGAGGPAAGPSPPAAPATDDIPAEPTDRLPDVPAAWGPPGSGPPEWLYPHIDGDWLPVLPHAGFLSCDWGCLAPGNFNRDRFVAFRRVGAGGYAQVFGACDRASGVAVAVKVVSKLVLAAWDLDPTGIRREAEVHRPLRHERLVTLYGAFEDPDFHYLVMEYVGGDSLHRWVGMLPSPRVRAIIRGVAEGLRYLHEDCGVVHNDLKPENVLIDDDGRVLITDFGAGARLDGSLSTVAWETAQYHAPELARRDPYGVAVDAWALGALLYRLLRGRPAFDVPDTDQDRLVAAILHDAPDLRGFEPSLHDLLAGLLAKDVAARLTVGEALRHPWLRDPNDGDHPDG